MRENSLLAPTRAVRCLGPRNHDGTIIPEGRGCQNFIPFHLRSPDQRWVGKIQFPRLGIIGFLLTHAAKRTTRWEALEPVRQAVCGIFGAIGQDIAQGFALRHDHGSQYLADDFQNEIAFLGIESSPAFVRAPEENGCAEKIIRTIREQLLWVGAFITLEDLRQALIAWQQTYKERWLIERHGHRSPDSVRRDYYGTLHKEAT